MPSSLQHAVFGMSSLNVLCNGFPGLLSTVSRRMLLTRRSAMLCYRHECALLQTVLRSAADSTSANSRKTMQISVETSGFLTTGVVTASQCSGTTLWFCAVTHAVLCCLQCILIYNVVYCLQYVRMYSVACHLQCQSCTCTACGF